MQISYQIVSVSEQGNIEIDVFRDGKVIFKNMQVGQLSPDMIKNEVKHRVAELLFSEKAKSDVGQTVTLTQADIDDINNRVAQRTQEVF